MISTIIKDIALLLIVVGGIVSFFYNPAAIDAKYLQMLMAGIVGYYTGGQEIPILSAYGRNK